MSASKKGEMSTNQQFVVNSLHNYLFWLVLAYVEPEFQLLTVTILLDEWRVHSLQP